MFVFEDSTGAIWITDVEGSIIQVSLSASNGQLTLSELTGFMIIFRDNNSSTN